MVNEQNPPVSTSSDVITPTDLASVLPKALAAVAGGSGRPVYVGEDGVAAAVLVSAAEFDRLVALDRALAAEEGDQALISERLRAGEFLPLDDVDDLFAGFGVGPLAPGGGLGAQTALGEGVEPLGARP